MKQGALMIRIAIGQAAFEAIARTLPLGSVGFENATTSAGSANVVTRWPMANKFDEVTKALGY